MARIPMTSGFNLCPEGEHVFRICGVGYNEEFGKLVVKMVNAQGVVHRERYSLMNKNGEPNEGAMNAFSYFAKTALNDYLLDEIDHTDIIDRYIRAEVVHTESESTKEPGKMMTFANLGDKNPADGFDTTPTEAALTMGADKPKERAPAPDDNDAPPAQESAGFDLSDLDELLK